MLSAAARVGKLSASWPPRRLPFRHDRHSAPLRRMIHNSASAWLRRPTRRASWRADFGDGMHGLASCPQISSQVGLIDMLLGRPTKFTPSFLVGGRSQRRLLLRRPSVIRSHSNRLEVAVRCAPRTHSHTHATAGTRSSQLCAPWLRECAQSRFRSNLEVFVIR